MKYLIVQDWSNTHGNHAGMKHMCDLLVEKYPGEYEMYVKECPRTWKSPHTFFEKVRWRLFDRYAQKKYRTQTFQKEYLQLCSPMFAKLKDNDEIFLLEYLLPWASQYELACYIRNHYPKVKIYALSHLTCKYFDEMTAKEPGLIAKWEKPTDKMLTLGSSLSAYFEKAGVPKEKISTGFHYVDSDYYHKQTAVEVHSPLRVIMIVANQATGKVKKYQAVCGTTLIMILPVSYVALKLGMPAYSVFIIHFIMEAVCQLARMIMLRPLIGLRVRDYFVHVYSKVFIVVAVSAIVPAIVYNIMDDTILRFFVVCALCATSVALVAYSIGLTPNEKVFVLAKAKDTLGKFRHR